MKVLLIGNYAPDRQESMARFASMLESELKLLGHEVRLLRPAARLNRAGAPPVGLAKWLGYFDKFALFPLLLQRATRRADVVHICDHSNAPYVRWLSQKPHLVTCHDLLAIRSALGLVPRNPTGWSGQLLQRFILRGLNRAARVECVSRHTRAQLLETSSLPADKTGVIENGLNYPYAPMPQKEATQIIRELLPQLGAEARFILHVGGNQWYKNRAGVLEIYRQLRAQIGDQAPLLILAGKPLPPALAETARQLPGVVGVSDVSNEALCALYSLAQVLIFPSLAEGFGWPIIEAQACGCRVLTTAAAPMNEVGGAAAFYADPNDIGAFANALSEVLNQTETAKQATIEAGIANAKRFNSRGMTESYLGSYRAQIEK